MIILYYNAVYKRDTHKIICWAKHTNSFLIKSRRSQLNTPTKVSDLWGVHYSGGCFLYYVNYLKSNISFGLTSKTSHSLKITSKETPTFPSSMALT